MTLAIKSTANGSNVTTRIPRRDLLTDVTLTVTLGLSSAIVWSCGQTPAASNAGRGPTTFTAADCSVELSPKVQDFPSSASFPELDPDFLAAIRAIRSRYYTEPELDSWLRGLSTRIEEARDGFEALQTDEDRVAYINQFLFDDERIQIVDSAEEYSISTRYGCPISTYELKTGNCQGASLLYRGISERLAFQVHCRLTPVHMYVTVENGGEEWILETTKDGQRISEKTYDNHFGPGPPAEAYRKNLSHDKLLGAYLFKVANDLLKESRGKDALEAALWAQRLFPEYGSIYGVIGLLLNHSNHHELGLPFHQLAICLEPDAWRGHREMARYLVHREEFEDAIPFLRRTIELQRFDIRRDLIVRLRLPEDRNTAVERAEHLLAAGNDEIDPAEVYRLAGDCLYLDKLELAQKLLETIPDDSELSAGLDPVLRELPAVLGMCTGDYSAAIAFVSMWDDSLIVHSSLLELPEYFSELAWCLAETGDVGGSQEALETARQLGADEALTKQAEDAVSPQLDEIRGSSIWRT